MNCHNLESLDDRTVDVSWNDAMNKKYLTSLIIHSNDDKNHLLDLVQIISMMNISVEGVKALDKGNKTIYQLDCYVKDLEQLSKVIMNIEKHAYIEKVERAMR